jgi:hypothetical protein
MSKKHKHERWRKIFKGWYAVSSFGRVKRLKRACGTHKGKILKTFGVYPTVILCIGDGKKIARSVHSLVAKAFLGKCPEGMEVDHKNKDISNSSLSNLRYKDMIDNRGHKGEENSHAKLSEDDVAKIRSKYARVGDVWGIKSKLARKYGVSRQQICNILLGKSWKETNV